MPSRRAAGSAEGTGNWNVTYFGSETSYGSSAAPRNLQSKFDCKKYVQHYMFRYNQKSSIGAPRWEPNDRKRVRSSAPLVSIARAAGGTKGTSGALRNWNATHSGSE